MGEAEALSDTYVSEKLKFEAEVTKTNEILHNTVIESNSQSIEKTTPLIMDKHDSMKDQIDKVIDHITSKKPVLLVGKSKTINRLISVVEIAKTKTPMRQYNKLIQQESVQNPNYKTNGAEKGDLVDQKKYMLPILFIYLVPKEITCDIDWTCQ